VRSTVTETVLAGGSMPSIVRLNCETRKPAVYGPSAFVSKPFLCETWGTE
jgi:hypothetical protein